MIKSQPSARAASTSLLVALAALLISPVSLTPRAQAADSQKWTLNTFEEFEQGRTEGVSIRSDGKLTLAPKLEEVFDVPATYLWALTRDSKGNVFAAGGPEARVFRIGADGRKSTFFETEGVAIHALAVDRKDHLYAATSPEAKVYKIDPSGGYTVFFEPEAAYVWDLEFGAEGELYVATGDPGRIYRVAPDGESKLYFEGGETHVRSLTSHPDGILIAGTDPGGLVIRVTPGDDGTGRGFVLYQSEKKEITSLAVDRDGNIYAAGIGRRDTGGGRPPPGSRGAPVGGQVSAPAASPTGTVQVATPAAPASAASTQQTAGASGRIDGGSEVYRLTPEGDPRRIWDSSSEIVYALSFDAEQRLLIATGEKGRLYRVESEDVYSLVVTSTSTQITALRPAGDGSVLMAASNIGRVLRLGPEFEKSGSWESDVFDAEIFTRWGRVASEADVPDGAAVRVSTRSGNLDTPARNWSDWSQTETPAARYLQARVEIEAGDGKQSPTLDAVEVFYRSKNLPPQITHLEPTPANYRFAPKPPVPQARTRGLPPLGQRAVRRRAAPVSPATAVIAESGYLGMRWAARDPNGDKLSYKLEIKGEGESTWKLLAEDLEEEQHDWDSTSFADGRYRVRLTASDQPANPSEFASSATRISEPFVIDNAPPAIEDMTVTPQPDALAVKFRAVDAVSVVQRAEYSLDGKDWVAILPTGGIFDAPSLEFEFKIPIKAQGEHTASVRVFDEFENVGTAKRLVR